MAKFCGKCGSKLDEITGLCPSCDAEKTEAHENKIEKAATSGKNEKTAAAKKNAKKIIVPILTVLGIAAVAVLTVVCITFISPMLHYSSAVNLLETGNYSKAADTFEKIKDYKDSKDKIIECKYLEAIDLMKNEKYTEAIAIFETIRVYSDSEDKIDECNYCFAVDLMENEKYEEAIEAFEILEGYKNSADYIKECYVGIYGEEFFEFLKELKTKEVGNTVVFGSYEQDGDTDNGSEKIEWYILEKENNKFILITKLGIESMPYHDEYGDATWETCTLRNWLNNDFIDTAFTDAEKSVLSEMNVTNSDNQYFGTDGGNDTIDKVKILSTEEAEKYFFSDYERICETTAYTGVPEDSCFWRLRTPGAYERQTDFVDSKGRIDYGYSIYGLGDYLFGLLIRPVICIDAAKFDLQEKAESDETVVETEETDENELGIPDCFKTESENWAEVYYSEVVSKINYIGYKGVFDTERVKSLFKKGQDRVIDDVFLPRDIMSAYWNIIGFEKEYGFLGIDYYSLDEICSNENVTEKDKEVLKTFFDETWDFADKYDTAILKAAMSYFYGKNTFDIEAISDEKNFYITEDGKGFYIQVGGIGGGFSELYFRLVDVKYEGNEAVLTMNIIVYNGTYTWLGDYTNGNVLVEYHETDVYELDNEASFELLCSENGIDTSKLGTMKLRIGNNKNNIFIIGWE